jgi:hypothetical protein
MAQEGVTRRQAVARTDICADNRALARGGVLCRPRQGDSGTSNYRYYGVNDPG